MTPPLFIQVIEQRRQSLHEPPPKPMPNCLPQAFYIAFLGGVGVAEMFLYLAVLIEPRRHWLLTEVNFNLIAALIVVCFVGVATGLQRNHMRLDFAIYSLGTTGVLFLHACALAYWVNFSVWLPLFPHCCPPGSRKSSHNNSNNNNNNKSHSRSRSQKRSSSRSREPSSSRSRSRSKRPKSRSSKSRSTRRSTRKSSSLQ